MLTGMAQDDPNDALAAVRAARAGVAGRARWSLARHAAFGGLMGGLIASYALPFPASLGGLVLCLALTGVVAATDRRRDGFFVNGYRAGRTRRIAIGIALFTIAALALAVWAQGAGLWWVPLVLGVLVFGVATRASIAWERAYQRELEGR
jgi:hypothetical protein